MCVRARVYVSAGVLGWGAEEGLGPFGAGVQIVMRLLLDVGTGNRIQVLWKRDKHS